MYGETVLVNKEDESKGSSFICEFKCLNCEALLYKELRYADNKHRCSSFRKDNTEKWCFKCSSWQKIDHFQKAKHVYGGFSKTCRTCRALYMKNAEDKRTKKIREYELDRKLSIRRASSLCSAALSRSKKYNLDFDLDKEYLLSLWKQQEGKCWYSNLEIKFGKTKVGFFSPSLDRRIPELGYTKGNVVFCLFAINSFKQELSEEEFISLLKTIEWQIN